MYRYRLQINLEIKKKLFSLFLKIHEGGSDWFPLTPTCAHGWLYVVVIQGMRPCTGQVSLRVHSLCGLVVKSSWLQIQRSGFDSRSYQIFWKVVDLERGPLSLVSAIQEPLGRKGSCSGQ
jgi:hypothetical protein